MSATRLANCCTSTSRSLDASTRSVIGSWGIAGLTLGSQDARRATALVCCRFQRNVWVCDELKCLLDGQSYSSIWLAYRARQRRATLSGPLATSQAHRGPNGPAG
jgi:hypothetical protein